MKMNLRQRFDDMMAEGLEEEIRNVADATDIVNAATAPILPVIAKLPDSEPFIAGAFLLGQDSDGEPDLLLTEPDETDPEVPTEKLLAWIKRTMAMEGLMECDSPCELLLDFNMAVVATAKDFSDAESMGWEALFAEIKNYERSTNRRALRQIAGKGQIQNLLIDVLKSMMKDFAVNLESFMDEAAEVNLDAPETEPKFSDSFVEEWE